MNNKADHKLAGLYVTWLMEISALLMVFPWLDQAIEANLSNKHYWAIPFSCWLLATLFFVVALLIRLGARKSAWDYFIYPMCALLVVSGIQALVLFIFRKVDFSLTDAGIDQRMERLIESIFGTIITIVVCSGFYLLLSRVYPTPEGGHDAHDSSEAE